MNEEEEETNSLWDLIKNLTANMESNFVKLHEELCSLRKEMKKEIATLKSNIKGVEKKGKIKYGSPLKIWKRQPKHWKTLKQYRRTRCKNCERFLQKPKLS